MFHHSAIEEAMAKKWIFGPDICDVWHSLDVLGTTGSILNLCVISLDRLLNLIVQVQRGLHRTAMSVQKSDEIPISRDIRQDESCFF